MTDNIIIDAEYMNTWLGESSKIENLSPKVLYDIKTLVEYYKDIIVPQKKVEISFPVEAEGSSPRASVTKGEVFIPYHMLQNGEIDNTIGAMIHELHHIKLSASERFLCSITFKFLRQLMDQIECGSMTMAERLFSDATITADKIMGWDDSTPLQTNDMKFLREAIGDLMFMINAVEDIRIDANTPPNLRKYITKLEKGASKMILERIDSGELHNDLRDINSIAFMILVHHKDIYEFPFIEDRYGDTDAIVSADALELPVSVFTAFKDEIAAQLLERYYAYCGKPKEVKIDDDGNPAEIDLDAYFGGKVKSTVGDSIESQFDKISDDSSDGDEKEGAALKRLGEEIKNVNVSTDIAPHGNGETEGETTDSKIDLSGKADTVRNWGDSTKEQTPREAGRELRKAMEEKNKTVYLDPSVISQINSFKNVQVITATEHFGDDKEVVYDSVLFDAIF